MSQEDYLAWDKTALVDPERPKSKTIVSLDQKAVVKQMSEELLKKQEREKQLSAFTEELARRRQEARQEAQQHEITNLSIETPFESISNPYIIQDEEKPQQESQYALKSVKTASLLLDNSSTKIMSNNDMSSISNINLMGPSTLEPEHS